jgi:hypothetical protein
MPLPTKDQVANFDYSYLGQPFVRYVSNSATIDTFNLDYSYLGQPFVAISDQVTISSSFFSVSASASESFDAIDASTAPQDGADTIYSVFSSWKNVYSHYKFK